MYRFPFARLFVFVPGLLLALLIPAGTASAQTYPPNTVVSSYTDARYCGDGRVSVVTDGSGALMDVCTSTGARIYPVAGGNVPYAPPAYNPTYPGGVPSFPGGVPYFPPGASPGAAGTAPYTVPPYSPGNGIVPPFNGGYVPPVAGSNGIPGTVIRQYNDGNSNCPNGDVTETTSGFYCTANGSPAAAGTVPTYNPYVNPAAPGAAPYFGSPYTTGTGAPPGYGTSGYNGINGSNGYNGTVIRQYYDGKTNCPNGDVTETTGGFYCTANGAPASRVG
jgi:hypothetical protein